MKAQLPGTAASARNLPPGRVVISKGGDKNMFWLTMEYQEVPDNPPRSYITNLAAIPNSGDPAFSAYQTNRIIFTPVLLLSDKVYLQADEESLIDSRDAQMAGSIYVTETEAYLSLRQVFVNLSTGEMVHDLPKGDAVGFSKWNLLYDDGSVTRSLYAWP